MPESKRVASDISIIGKRIQKVETEVNQICDYVRLSSANRILANEVFWGILENVCNKIQRYVRESKIYIYNTVVDEWIQLLKLIITKDNSLLKEKLLDGSIKKICNELLDTDTQHPNWFMKKFFNSFLRYFNFGNDSLYYFFKVVWGGINYSTQGAFIDVIISNFDNHYIYNYIRTEINNKEQQKLFDCILGADNNNTRSIREFLNKFNSAQVPVNIFSFMSSEIKINGLLLDKHIWVDINVRSKTITFSCKLTAFTDEESVQNSSEDDQQFDTACLQISHIRYLRFKRGVDDSEDALTLELTKPLTADFESSNKFLEPFRIVVIRVSEHKERFLNFISYYFAKNVKNPIDILDQNYFDLNLSPSSDDVSSDTNSVLGTDTAHSEESKDEDIDKQNIDETELGEPLVIEASVSDHEQYNSTIFHTPQLRNDPDISVEETIAHSDSSFNVSVAASYDSPRLLTTQEDSGIDNEPSQYSCKSVMRVGLSQLPTSVPETPEVYIRTPEIINELSTDKVALIASGIDFCARSTQIEESKEISKERNSETNITVLSDVKEKSVSDVASEANQSQIEKEPPAGPSNVAINYRSLVSSLLSDVREKSFLDVQSDANQPQDSNVEKEPLAGPSNMNITNDHQSLTSSVISRSSQNVQKNSQSIQKDPDLYVLEDDQQSCESPGTQLSVNSKESISSSQRGKKRKMKNRKYSVDDDLAEFDETSFFSDKETKANEFTYTKTRVVKKHRPFQYTCDIDANKRKSTPRKNKIKAPVPVVESVRRIKTILPLRKPENVSNIPSTENIDATKYTERKRIISNINNINHLEEQSEGQVFRMSVSMNQTILPQNRNVIDSQQEFNHEVEIPVNPGQIINETHREISSNMDIFDKMKYNIPASQDTQKNINFFSSSSCASQSSQNEPQHQQLTAEEEASQNVNNIIELVSPISNDAGVIGEESEEKKSAAKKVVPAVIKKRACKRSLEQNIPKVTRKRKTDFIKEIQNASGDQEIITNAVKNFVEQEELANVEAFRILMPKIGMHIKEIFNLCLTFVPVNVKAEFRNKMREYFTDEEINE